MQRRNKIQPATDIGPQYRDVLAFPAGLGAEGSSMTRNLAAMVAWLCTAWLVAMPAAALYLLIRIDTFASLAMTNLALPIRWYTVSDDQWLALWALTALYLTIGYAGVWHLRKAFRNFARGEWFDVENSLQLRRRESARLWTASPATCWSTSRSPDGP